MPKWRHAKTSNEKSVILLALGQFVKIWNKACCCWHRAVFWDGRLWGNCDICFFSFTQINRNIVKYTMTGFLMLKSPSVYEVFRNASLTAISSTMSSIPIELFSNIYNDPSSILMFGINLTTWNAIFSRKQTLGDVEEITNLNEIFKPNRKSWSNIFQKCNIWLNIIEILSYFKKASEQV